MSARRAAERFLIGVGALALGKETNPEHPQKRDNDTKEEQHHDHPNH